VLGCKFNHSFFSLSTKLTGYSIFNPLKTKCSLLYSKTQSVPCSKHYSSRL